MRRFVNQITKDARLLWWLAAAWLLLVALFQVLMFRMAFVPSDLRLVDPVARALAAARSLIQAVIVALFAVLAVGVVQADPAIGTTAFWFTRPISVRLLLAAKFLFTGVLLVLVPIAADVVALLAAGLRPGDALATIPASLLVQLAWLLPVMALAAVTLNIAQFVFATLLEAILFVVSLMVLRAYGSRLPFGPLPSRAPLNFPYVVLALALAVLGAVVVVYAYRARALVRAAAVMTISCAALPALVLLWPLGLAWPHPPRISSPTRVVMSAGSMSLNPVGRGRWRLTAGVDFTGVPSRQVVSLAGVDAWIEYPSERLEMGNRSVGTPTAGQWMRAMAEALQPARLVIAPARDGTSAFDADIPEQDYRRHAYQSGTFHADLRLWVDEVRVAAAVPVKATERYGAMGRTGQILDAWRTPGGFGVSLREAVIQPLLWTPDAPPVLYAVRNSRLGLAAFPNATSLRQPLVLRAPWPAPAHLVGQWTTYTIPSPKGVSAGEWMQGAELVVLDSVQPGYVLAHVTIDDITLSSLRHIGPPVPR